jgi:hypothetical protein
LFAFFVLYWKCKENGLFAMPGGGEVGRPRKYTAAALRKAVEEYFDGISREVPATVMVDSGERDKFGHVVYRPERVKNKRGEEVMLTEYITPPTIGGLCLHLGITRETWAKYSDAPGLSDTTSRAKGRIRAYLECELLTRKDSGVKGIMFDLENNHGMRERVDHSGVGAIKIEIAPEVAELGQ